jgi:hypothetical protein
MASKIFLVLAAWFIVIAITIPTKGKEIIEIYASYTPGLILLAISISLESKSGKNKDIASSLANKTDETLKFNLIQEQITDLQSNSRDFVYSSNICIALSIFLAIYLNAIGKDPIPSNMIIGAAIAFLTVSLFVWGCVNFSRWKGYSGWLGIAGYLLIPGLLVLYFLPNKRSKLTCENHYPFDETLAAKILKMDYQSSIRYTPLLFPSIALFLVVISIFLYHRMPITLQEWELGTVHEKNFSVMMPSEPRVTELLIPTPNGKIPQRQFIASPGPNNSKGMFLVVETDFRTIGTLDESKLIDALEKSKDETIKLYKGTVIQENRLMVGRYPALDILIKTQKSGCITSRLVFTKYFSYQILVDNGANRLWEHDIKKFISSFKLLGENEL